MTRRRVHLSSKWPTLAETARVFKLSAATQRRISGEVAEFLKKYKGNYPPETVAAPL